MQQELAIAKEQQRLDCSICNYRVDPNDKSAFFSFPCTIRALMDEKFNVWRCPDCQTIHCLEIVDLDYYYSKYPFSEAQLVWPLRIFYNNLTRQLTKHGFSKSHSFLDYGCGTHGLFVEYLQQRGFTNVDGYDPYAPEDGLGDRAIKSKKYDYVSTQDVIEHVEDPHEFLKDINRLVSPGGYILVGTPNAAGIALDRPDVPDHCYALHLPYHLHIYTRETLESLGKAQGWEPIDFFNRKYDDTPWLCLNSRAINAYMQAFDGSMDVLAEPLKLGKAFTSPQFFFWSIFGYWFSHHASMSVMFRKSID
jgi:2-polyprenyl-3-methyl-5-hydroxy-6-metoxy-1,4-benzoquinol methylase